MKEATNAHCPICFEVAACYEEPGKGRWLKCSKVRAHNYAKGKRVTYTTMTGSGPDGTWYGTYRATAFKRGKKWFVDMTNATKIAAHVVDGMAPFDMIGASKKCESPVCPAWDFTMEAV